MRTHCRPTIQGIYGWRILCFCAAIAASTTLCAINQELTLTVTPNNNVYVEKIPGIITNTATAGGGTAPYTFYPLDKWSDIGANSAQQTNSSAVCATIRISCTVSDAVYKTKSSVPYDIEFVNPYLFLLPAFPWDNSLGLRYWVELQAACVK